MAKFFSKPIKPTLLPVTVQESAIAGPSRLQSDFERMFKPFVLQKDKTLAPINWFAVDKKRKRRGASQTPNKKEVIILDSDEEDSDIEMLEPTPTEEDLASLSPQGMLEFLIS